jgi:hypothetical protein
MILMVRIGSNDLVSRSDDADSLRAHSAILMREHGIG